MVMLLSTARPRDPGLLSSIAMGDLIAIKVLILSPQLPLMHLVGGVRGVTRKSGNPRLGTMIVDAIHLFMGALFSFLSAFRAYLPAP